MGYAGATYLVQELCNALFDALFAILPLGSDLDRIDPTPARAPATLPWDPEASRRLDEIVEATPFVARISAAKQLRDQAEMDARRLGEATVTVSRLSAADRALTGRSG
jgi:chlorophyllide a reductase subunit Z